MTNKPKKRIDEPIIKELEGVFMTDFKNGKPDIKWVSFNYEENKHIKRPKLKRMVVNHAKRLNIK